MRKYLAITFGALTLLTVVLWICGALTAAVVPWLGGIRAEHIGRIGAAIFICAEGLIYLFGWLAKRCSHGRKPGGTTLKEEKRPTHNERRVINEVVVLGEAWHIR